MVKDKPKTSVTVARRAGRPPASADRDADATRANILAVAIEEFSAKGLAGGRVDEIAERTHTVKRMIYYYFGSKEGLYRAVLEHAYDHIRTIESDLDLDSLPPDEALRHLVKVTFDYHNKHPEFVRLVMNENIHQGAQPDRHRHAAQASRPRSEGRTFPRRSRSHRGSHVDQRAGVLQRVEPLH